MSHLLLQVVDDQQPGGHGFTGGLGLGEIVLLLGEKVAPVSVVCPIRRASWQHKKHLNKQPTKQPKKTAAGNSNSLGQNMKVRTLSEMNPATGSRTWSPQRRGQCLVLQRHGPQSSSLERCDVSRWTRHPRRPNLPRQSPGSLLPGRSHRASDTRWSLCSRSTRLTVSAGQTGRTRLSFRSGRSRPPP